VPLFYHRPNPYLADPAEPSKPSKDVSVPLTKEITAGKNTYVYDAHTYHTKVPPQGIRPVIEHYTRPGDVVLDPFCGSGMTGVAAIESGRVPILIDLSPAATFIAYNLLTPICPRRYRDAVHAVLDQARDLEDRLYGTHCPRCRAPAVSLYTVWSYRMVCSHCDHEFQLWDVARDERARVRESRVKTEFACPRCNELLKKRLLRRTVREPVSIGSAHCRRGQKELTALPDSFDRQVINSVSYDDIPSDLWYPTDGFPDGVNTRQAVGAGISSVDKAYTPRALWAMAYLWDIARRWPDDEVRSKLLFTLTSLYQRVTVFSEFRFWGGSGNTANYSVPAIMNEQNVFRAFERKANTIRWYFESAPRRDPSFRISTQSSCHLAQLPDKSVDFVFTDPPFGANINYSEMNFLWESWLGVYTDPTEEAIVNKVQGKGVSAYGRLLHHVFSEVRRVLKDNAWLVLVFHNSSSQIWSALQGALERAGFTVRGTQTFDKRHGTFKQFVSDNAVGYDLVLHCQKTGSARPLRRASESEVRERAREFIRSALAHHDRDYVVRYLHVSRDSEIDHRRLYAEWLAETLSQEEIRLSFEDFRALVLTVLEANGAPTPPQSRDRGLLS
jgi:DNA modification methylase/transcription elongation factor Elf1